MDREFIYWCQEQLVVKTSKISEELHLREFESSLGKS